MLTDKHISYLTTLNGWCVPHKMQRLYDLVIEANKNLSDNEPLLICEAGVFAGRSLFPMAIACKDMNKGIVYGFEMWDNQTAIEGEEISPENTHWWKNLNMEHIMECFIKTIGFLGLEDYVSFHRAKSYEGADIMRDGWVSLFHMDSQHNTHTIIKELDAWAPKIKIGGFLVVDDCDWPSVKEAYSKIPEYGFELLEHNRVEVPRTQPQEYTEYAVYKKVR